MDANEPVVIHTTSNLAEAEVLKNVLEGEGIKCELEGENQGSFAGVLDVRILVRPGTRNGPGKFSLRTHTTTRGRMLARMESAILSQAADPPSHRSAHESAHYSQINPGNDDACAMIARKNRYFLMSRMEANR